MKSLALSILKCCKLLVFLFSDIFVNKKNKMNRLKSLREVKRSSILALQPILKGNVKKKVESFEQNLQPIVVSSKQFSH